MPSKEDVVLPTQSFLSADMEEIVAAIKHNLHLKSSSMPSSYSSTKPSVYSTKPSAYSTKQRRASPYAAPVRTVCRNNKTNSNSGDEHSPSSCKYCVLRSKSSSKDTCPQDPYEILTYLRQGILISEAVKRLQCKRKTDFDFYDLEQDAGI